MTDKTMKKSDVTGANVQDEQTTTANGENKATVKMPKYMVGMPKQYRFDAKVGGFNIDGTTKLKGNSFSFKPIAYRVFADSILGLATRKWVEFFFIDAQNCVSAILFHGHSVENLLQLNAKLFYAEQTLDRVEITATAIAHTKKLDDGTNTTYYVADFSFEVLSDEELQKITAIVDKLRENEKPIYRRDTLTEFADVKIAHNYNPGIEPEKLES